VPPAAAGKGLTMLQAARATTCPLCGARLGASVDGQWVSMALDEFREHTALRLIPNSEVMAAPDSCIACGFSRQRAGPPTPQTGSAVSGGTHVIANSNGVTVMAGIRREPH